MHPAPSIIAFTTFSGMGFGLLFWLALGFPPVTGATAFAFFTIAYLMAVGGLAASALHLGNPQRALLAFTQWRSSWLSREAILSTATLIVMAITGAAMVFFHHRPRAIALPGAALCLATVAATSMIYAQLKTVPRWNHWTTPALFLALSLSGGAALAGQSRLAAPMLLATGGLQLLVWVLGDRRFTQRGTTIETATGLGKIGKVRLFAPPHTGANYLLKEMVYQMGRKHRTRLRILSLIFMALIPAAVLATHPGHILGGIAILSHLAGTLAARWLFFAEAEHVMGLYYGAHTDASAAR